MTNRRRSPGDGSYFQEPDGSWRAKLTVHLPSGATSYKRFRGRTLRAVRAKAAEWRAEQARGAPTPDAQLTTGAYLERWLTDQAKPGLRPGAFVSYRLNVRRLTPLIGGIKLTALRSADIQRAYAELLACGLSGRPLSRRSVEQAHSVLHNALERAVDWELLTRNPCRAVTVPRAERTDRPTLSIAQARHLFAHSREDRWHPLWVILITCGLRVGELCGLRWEDVDLAAGRLTVRRKLERLPDGGGLAFAPPKSRKGRRQVPLSAFAVATLHEWWARQQREQADAQGAWRGEEPPLVFGSTTGYRLENSRVNDQWHRARIRAGLPHVRPHDLRHTTASLWLEAGFHPKVVADLLGHSTIVLTLDTYSHTTTEQGERAAAWMDQVFGGSGTNVGPTPGPEVTPDGGEPAPDAAI